MSRSIRSYLPDPNTPREMEEFVGFRMKGVLKQRVNLVCEKYGWTKSEVARAALEKFTDDELPKSDHFELPRGYNPENRSSWK